MRGLRSGGYERDRGSAEGGENVRDRVEELTMGLMITVAFLRAVKTVGWEQRSTRGKMTSL